MRILIVTHALPPQSVGGSEIYVDAFARALVRLHGDEVLVLTREDDPERPDYAVRREARDGLRIVWINNTFRSVRSFEESYENGAIADVARGIVDEFRP